jgi:hypothetical protein
MAITLEHNKPQNSNKNVSCQEQKCVEDSIFLRGKKPMLSIKYISNERQPSPPPTKQITQTCGPFHKLPRHPDWIEQFAY